MTNILHFVCLSNLKNNANSEPSFWTKGAFLVFFSWKNLAIKLEFPEGSERSFFFSWTEQENDKGDENTDNDDDDDGEAEGSDDEQKYDDDDDDDDDNNDKDKDEDDVNNNDDDVDYDDDDDDDDDEIGDADHCKSFLW